MNNALFKISGIKSGTHIYHIDKLADKKAHVVKGKKKYSSVPYGCPVYRI